MRFRDNALWIMDRDPWGSGTFVPFQYAKDGRVLRLALGLRRPRRRNLYKPIVIWRSWRDCELHLGLGVGFVALGWRLGA